MRLLKALLIFSLIAIATIEVKDRVKIATPRPTFASRFSRIRHGIEERIAARIAARGRPRHFGRFAGLRFSHGAHRE